MTDPKEVFGKWMVFIDESMLLRYRNMLMQCTLNNIPIEPSPERVFSCFKHTKAENLKVVILGQDPYFDGSATGLAFANSADSMTLISVVESVSDNAVPGVEVSANSAIMTEEEVMGKIKAGAEADQE